MSMKKFKFVSPGVFINEIDNSFIPKQQDVIGPLVIGRAERGPAMRPKTVDSFSQFIENFGYPIPGGNSDDIPRNGNRLGPTYGPYAAEAFLRAGVGPLTYVRLLGVGHQDATDDNGKAGWKTADYSTGTGNGGAYGLFLFPSGNAADPFKAGGGSTDITGTLAALFYMKEGYTIELTGVMRGTTTPASGTSVLIASEDVGDAYHSYRAQVKKLSDNSVVHKTLFNMNDNSEKYIRKRFNTNPTLTNSTITNNNNEYYWLGETFDRAVRHLGISGSSWGLIAAVQSTDVYGPHKMKQDYQNAKTGWFISQDTTTATGSYNPHSMQKLFRLISRDHGEWHHRNLKVSIERIKKSATKSSKYGSFSVVLRHIADNDTAPRVIERFDNCSLDSTSPNYVARKIGDQYEEWHENERRYRTRGQFANNSNFIRVDMDADLEDGTIGNPTLLPFGYWGPPRYRPFTIVSGSTNVQAYSKATASFNDATGIAAGDILFQASSSIIHSFHAEAMYGGTIVSSPDAGKNVRSGLIMCGPICFTGAVLPQELPIRVSSSDHATSDPNKSYFGFQTARDADSTVYDPSIPDHLRVLPAGLSDSSTEVEYAYIFSLDDVSGSSATEGVWVSGSRNGEGGGLHSTLGASLTAISGTYEGVLDRGFRQFTAPFYGGFDGLDVMEKEPFRNSGMASATHLNNYQYNTVKRAIDVCADPEYIEFNLATMPGITKAGLTTHLMNVCEDRGDALAIIDLEDVYTAETEGTKTLAQRPGTVSGAIASLRNRQLDSSYGCSFYPWVQVKDGRNGRLLWAPPSVPMMGVFASSEAASELWFAPAGFNRGGLSQGAAGIPVLGVTERLVSRDRDSLYDANINPIASFPSNGIVVFGQKTLQMDQSALDRINVRRLTIYLKKQISRLATRVLFDQNVKSTWNRFIALVEPFLANTKARFGISEYRLILDETTTTPDLIDQNIMYAKIMVKPTRAIEFIAIDFVIASTGASFDD